MRGRKVALVALAVLAIGGSLFVAPPASHAVIITDIVVNFGGGAPEFCGNIGGACAGGATKIWDLGPAGVNLATGQTLVLTQTGGGATGFNFDTSDFGFGAAVVTINGSAFADPTGILNGTIHGVDPVDTAHQEATDWTAIGSVPGSFSVQFGYADNIHTNACSDVDGNCLPEGPFADATVFLGAGALPPAGYPQGGVNHCIVTTSTCFDGGTILITALARTPEPSALFLLGTGLMGLAFGRRYLKKNS